MKGVKKPGYNFDVSGNAVIARSLVYNKPNFFLNQQKLSRENCPDAQRLVDNTRIGSSNMRETANKPLAGRSGKRKLGERRMTSSYSSAAKSPRGALAKTSRTRLSGRAHTESEQEELWSNAEEGAYHAENMREMMKLLRA